MKNFLSKEIINTPFFTMISENGILEINLYDKRQLEYNLFSNGELYFDENGSLYIKADELLIGRKNFKEILLSYFSLKKINGKILEKAGIKFPWTGNRMIINEKLFGKITENYVSCNNLTSNNGRFQFWDYGWYNYFMYLKGKKPAQFKISNYKIRDFREKLNLV